MTWESGVHGGHKILFVMLQKMNPVVETCHLARHQLKCAWAGSGHPHTWWQGPHCMSLYCINVHSKMFKRHWVLGWSGSLAAIHSTLVLFVFTLEFQYNTLFGSQLFFYLDLKIINRDDICCYKMFSRISIKPIIVKELDSLANKTVINILQGCEMMGKLSIFSLIRFHAKDWWADCHSKLF